MVGRRRRENIFVDIGLGMLGGVVGTIALQKAMPLLGKPQSGDAKWRENQLVRTPANTVLAYRILDRAAPERLNERNTNRLAQGLHWSYGVFWGGLYGALRSRVPFLSFAGGIPFGVLFGLIGNEAMTAGLKLTPPPRKFPLSTHVKNVAGHIVYAMAVDATMRGGRSLPYFRNEAKGARLPWSSTLRSSFSMK